jgi:RNA recognition motif-containing protein
MRIYVGNLPYRITDQELGDFFAQLGRVQMVRIVPSRLANPDRGQDFLASGFVRE